MVISPPLLLVSALFFPALSSAFYAAAFLAATLVLRARRGRMSPAFAKQVLLVSLLPPALGAVPILGGATLRHSHARPLLEHHSPAWRELFSNLFVTGIAGGEAASRLAGTVPNGLAWLLGIFFLTRLIVATACLERGLTPHLSRPSARLEQAVALVGLLSCVFFYLRPVRLPARRWREETELACDATAVKVNGDPLAMAAAILRVTILRVSGVPAGAAHCLPWRRPLRTNPRS